ncbi:MAG: hypothetical protein V4484_01365 [Pseudomonadota bacterium]
MKLTFTRASVLLALAIGLTACGGGKASFQVAGTVTGLTYDGLVITNATNGDTYTVTKPAADKNGARTFALSKSLDYGQTYDVRITQQPEHETCTLYGGQDTAGRMAAINLVVVCAVHQFTIGGTITGMPPTAGATASGLVLANGTDHLAVEISGAYVMPTKVPYGNSYHVGIASQPAGKTCAIVTPGTEVGTVKSIQHLLTVELPVDNINIDCH